MSDDLEFCCPTKMLCGRRALEHLPYELAVRNARKPLLLTDEDAFRENRTRALTDALKASGITLGVLESLPAALEPGLLQQLAAIYRDRDHDALLLMGAGPLVDLGKLLNLAVATGRDDPARIAEAGTEGIRLQPAVLIAAAAASGYEAAGRLQIGPVDLRSLALMPDLVLVDARTLGAGPMEPVIEAALTALAVGAEAVLNPACNPMVDIYAANAVRMAAAALETAHTLPDGSAPRMQAACAAAMAGGTLAAGAPGLIERLANRLAATERVSRANALGCLLPATIGHGAVHWKWAPGDLLPLLVGLDRAAVTPARQQALMVQATLMGWLNDIHDLTGGRIPRTLADAGFNAEELKAFWPSGDGGSHAADHEAARRILHHALDGRPYDAHADLS
jgi:alcohol dehydrogenase